MWRPSLGKAATAPADRGRFVCYAGSLNRTLASSLVLSAVLFAGAMAHADEPASPSEPAPPSEPALSADATEPTEAPAPSSELMTAPGVAAFQKADYAGALTLFDEAVRLAPLPEASLWRARTLVKLHRLLEAERAFNDIVASKPAQIQQTYARAKAQNLAIASLEEQNKAKERAEVELAEVVELIPSLALTIEGAELADVKLSVNGQPFSAGQRVRFDPGAFRIEARHADGRAVVRDIQLAERDAASMRLPFVVPREPDDPGATQRTVGWVAIGVGATAAAVGTVLGVIALAQYASADCPDDRCPASELDAMDSYNALRMPAGVILITGGMVAALGIGLVIAAPDADAGDGGVAAVLSPGFVGLKGSF